MSVVNLPEIDILTALFCKTKEFHPYLMRVEKTFFSSKLQPFFGVLQDFYKKYGKPPAKSVFETELQEEDKKIALEVFESIKLNFHTLKTMDYNYLVDKIDLFVKKSLIKSTLLRSHDDYMAGEYDTIIKNFSTINQHIIDNDMGSSYFDPEFFISKYSKEKSGLPIRSGSNQFDSTFGGLHRKALSIIAGPSNSGKTMFLTNLTALMLSMVDEVKNILYITLEINEEEIAKRIDASLLGEPIKSLGKKLNHKIDGEPLLQKFATILEGGNRLYIKSMRSGSSASDIASLIRNLSLVPIKGTDRVFKPDVVIVDYLGLLKPDNPTKNMNSYEKGRDISEELRQIAQDFNLAMVVAAQTNRNSFANEVTQDSISDSIAIVQTSDLMLTINRNEELDAASQVMIYLAKSRFSRTGNKFLFTADYDCMRLNDIDTGRVTDTTLDTDNDNL
jgi:replicative DNA helicase